MLTGKGPEWGGSQIRPEATGYGAVFFAENILKDEGKDLKVRGGVGWHERGMHWGGGGGGKGGMRWELGAFSVG